MTTKIRRSLLDIIDEYDADRIFSVDDFTDICKANYVTRSSCSAMLCNFSKRGLIFKYATKRGKTGQKLTVYKINKETDFQEKTTEQKISYMNQCQLALQSILDNITRRRLA